MPHGALEANGMAFSNNSRSFTNIGSAATSDNKCSGSSLNPAYGNASKTWGANNIWGSGSLTNGFGSRAATRDNSRSRDRSRQPSTSGEEVIEGKTGSGSLVDSSVSDDWNYRTSWGGKRSLPSGRSISHAQPAETSTFQQRSVSNAGLPMSFSSTTQCSSVFATRPPTISLNSTSAAQPRQDFASTSSGRYPGRGNEQPPNVYTKFDRPPDPNTRKLPDSAKEGVWADCPPTEERKSGFTTQTGSRIGSIPSSRDGSIQSTNHGDEHPFFNRLDYSRPTQRPAQNCQHSPAALPQWNGLYNPSMNADSNQLSSQLSELNINLNNRPPTSYRSSVAANAGFSPSSPLSSSSLFPHSALGGAGTRQDIADDLEEIHRLSENYLSLDGYISPQQTPALIDYTHGNYGPRTLQTPTASEFSQSQAYTNGTSASRPSYNPPNGLRMGGNWSTTPDGTLLPARRSPNIQEQTPYVDLRMQQILAAQLRGAYGPVYSPYSLPNAVPFGAAPPFVPFLPMNLPAVENTADARDVPVNVGDSMQSALMYEFKSNTKSRKYELKDIYDHIAEFSGDQHGSRFIQTKLETANSDEKDRVFREIQPNAIQLMTDVFGNYVIQKFFEHGDQTHKKILANKMKGQVLALSLQMYGCRVVQKALDHVLVDQQHELVSELENHVLRCVKDQNGNHVIQKAIERCPPETINFVIRAFRGQVQHLSIHPYGCRVIQRCLEQKDPLSKGIIMAELMDGIQSMISDQYGNYVVQHVVQHDDGEGRRHVLDIVGRGLEAYSKHKFASNVVERCLDRADDGWRRKVVYAIANGRGEGEGVFVGMIKDSYGNYVIQKLLETLATEDYLHFLDLLQPAMAVAKRTGCGKQALSIEKKMHRFPAYRGGPANSGAYNPNGYRLPLHAPMFGSNIGSAATTPPPLTADTQSLQSSAIQSINGDAVEGASVGSRKGSELSNEGYFR